MTPHRKKGALETWLPAGALALSVLWLLGGMAPERKRNGFDLAAFGRIPVLHEGRVKPFDTVARSSLLVLRSKQTLYNGERRLSAVEWALDAMAKPESANRLPLFVIDDPDVLGLIGLESKGRYYSFADIQASLGEIASQAEKVEPVESAKRSRFQSAVMNLNQRIILYQRLRNSLQVPGTEDFPADIAEFQKAAAAGISALGAHGKSKVSAKERKALEALSGYFERFRFLAEAAYFQVLPPRDGESAEHWHSMGEGLLQTLNGASLHPSAMPLASALSAWRRGDAEAFNRAVHSHLDPLASNLTRTAALASRESFFNRYEPFYKGMALYVAALLLAFLGWMFWEEALGAAAFRLMSLGFLVHTGGLLARMLLQGRPPVTNLYSSAIFVGWTAVGVGIVLERLYRNGLGTVTASAAGFITLIVAHHLSSSGDTMEMMRAVLDSNFWLATHVVTITVGYGGAFLAAFLAHLYIFRGLFTPSLDEALARTLARMTYGVVCFTLFFSFVGTVLGGIWADQSWGRFWGWDPKENGALLIVLWCAFMLHARWAGFVRERGFTVLAVFGAILTSFSWFGVNMLGIGLHSYGFMDKAFVWLTVFVLSQCAVMAMGSLPARYWRSPAAFPPSK